MNCPYLTQVTMVFCQASPLRKLIPSDRITTATSCEGDAYRVCPLYKEALGRALHTIEEVEAEESSTAAAARKGVTP
jgi:hypothetical protein